MSTQTARTTSSHDPADRPAQAGQSGQAARTPQQATDALVAAVRDGNVSSVVTLTRAMTTGERRAALSGLKALRKELRTDSWSRRSRRTYPALHAAGAACHTGAVATATWLTGADMRWSPAPPKLLLEVFADRGPEWQGEVARRLAERPPSARVAYELMSGLVRLADCAVPTTESYVRGWMDEVRRHRLAAGPELLGRLRSDPHLVTMVTALFELDDIGAQLEWSYGRDGTEGWIPTLTWLTAEGALERTAMLDACVAWLLRGGRTADQRAFLTLLGKLAPTRDEERQRTADWTALVADAGPTVAAHAQAVLGAMALDGELTARQLAEVSRGALFRPEKKLVRSQLILLGKVFGASSELLPELLPAVADAFGHQDTDLQERALKLVEKYAAQVPDSVREEILAAAEQLSAPLRPRAARALGGAPRALESTDTNTEPYEEFLPPVPEPGRPVPPIGSVAELTEEVSALLLASSGRSDAVTFERVLDALVRYAHTDREALVEAVRPVVVRRWWYPGASEHGRPNINFGVDTYGIEVVLASLFEVVRTATLHTAARRSAQGLDCCVHAVLEQPRQARLWEAAYRVASDRPPFLLATPSWTSGQVDPAELVARLDAYRRLGVSPGEVDFAQALLRVRRDERAQPGTATGPSPEAAAAVTAATGLGTPEGDRLARWLADGEPPLPSLQVVTDQESQALLVEVGQAHSLFEGLPAVFHAMGAPLEADTHASRSCYHWTVEREGHELLAVPGRRELVAARLVGLLSQTARYNASGDVAYLPSLAEAPGPAGPAVHLSVAYGIGARNSEERVAAVDALLVLAARGQLDVPLLGGLLSTLMLRGTVKPSRAVDSVRTAAATGAYRTVGAVLRETLPALLAGPAHDGKALRGVADLLAVAAECAEHTGDRGTVPHLAELAARSGSARLLTQARRLHAALGAESTG
ncbi:DUF6493 family protein [Streptomyces sp. NPDC127068]|uniref:DUF7824 domain-containing protein n=1 Tax=Streptomyces sp. NPDC127068 TaxID=3347127 RepID=UPI003659954B